MAEPLKIAIGSDHAAFKLKETVTKHLQSQGVDLLDCGTRSTESCDYPDFAGRVASAVSARQVDFGILLCGTGIGMSIAANKYANVRAALATNEMMAKAARGHNDANILCLGARVTDETTALKLVDIFLSEPFEGGRHLKRVNKIQQQEKKLC